MSRTLPNAKTWITGDLPTGPDFNAEIRDNLLAMWNPPRCRYVRATGDTNQSIPNNNPTLLSYPTVQGSDPEGFRTSNTVWTIPAALDGWYSIGACVYFASNTTGQRRLIIYRNGTVVLTSDQRNPAGGAQQTRIALAVEAELVAGDTLSVEAFQDSGGALDASVAPNPYIYIKRG